MIKIHNFSPTRVGKKPSVFFIIVNMLRVFLPISISVIAVKINFKKRQINPAQFICEHHKQHMHGNTFQHATDMDRVQSAFHNSHITLQVNPVPFRARTFHVHFVTVLYRVMKPGKLSSTICVQRKARANASSVLQQSRASPDKKSTI